MMFDAMYDMVFDMSCGFMLLMMLEIMCDAMIDLMFGVTCGVMFSILLDMMVVVTSGVRLELFYMPEQGMDIKQC